MKYHSRDPPCHKSYSPDARLLLFTSVCCTGWPALADRGHQRNLDRPGDGFLFQNIFIGSDRSQYTRWCSTNKIAEYSFLKFTLNLFLPSQS